MASSHYSIEDLWDIDISNGDSINALKYLNCPENFPSFSSGLTELMVKYSYDGSVDDVEEKTSFICSKLSSIHVKITRTTVKDWFTDKHHPSFTSISRTIMYQICFALSASLDDVKWFFRCVYFNRSFNCHTIDEAVYYYCFSHNLTYDHAQALIITINSLPCPPDPVETANIFTREICARLDGCSTDEELLDFFKENKNVFNQWNKSASSYIRYFLSIIQGKRSDKAIIEMKKKGKPVPPSEIKKCGLVIQEFLPQLDIDQDFLGDISGKNIASIDFMLDIILNTTKGIDKNAQIHNILRINFPSKKAFSDILGKSDTSTSYDSIRKCLILLKFYDFWCKVKLRIINIPVEHNPWEIFCDEVNSLLISCGYEELFFENPYDWLFLWAASTYDPLGFLRDAVNNIEILE